MKNSCLIIIFNHKYNENIVKLKALYQDKFSDIYFVVPFYEDILHTGGGYSIIPVYYSSYFFQGYIAQAYDVISGIEEYKHYVVVGDDLILNPIIDENNIGDYLGLRQGESYTNGMGQINKIRMPGERLYRYNIEPFKVYNGTHWKNELPKREDAFEICRAKGKEYSDKITWRWIFREFWKNAPKHKLNELVYAIRALTLNHSFAMPYPLYQGYSDFIVISNEDMKPLCKMLGVMAAMGVFVETAIPTAMMLTCEKVVTSRDIERKGMIYWGDDRKKFGNKYAYSLEKLFSDWDENIIFQHPVKLSEWR